METPEELERIEHVSEKADILSFAIMSCMADARLSQRFMRAFEREREAILASDFGRKPIALGEYLQNVTRVTAIAVSNLLSTVVSEDPRMKKEEDMHAAVRSASVQAFRRLSELFHYSAVNIENMKEGGNVNNIIPFPKK